MGNISRSAAAGFGYSEDGLRIHDYQLVVQNVVKKDSGKCLIESICNFLFLD